MTEHPYLPGKAIILSRLPAKDWFTLDEVAAQSGWSRSFIRDRVKMGELPAQEYQKPVENRAKGKGTHQTYRIHVDDLVVFIMKNGSGRYSEERPFRDVVSIIRTWPVWMIRELLKVINRLLPTPGPGTEPSTTIRTNADTDV
jgi:hypothetical protein